MIAIGNMQNNKVIIKKGIKVVEEVVIHVKINCRTGPYTTVKIDNSVVLQAPKAPALTGN